MKIEDFLLRVGAIWGPQPTDNVLRILASPVAETALLRHFRERGHLLAVDRELESLDPGFQGRTESGVVGPVIVDLIKLAVEVRWNLHDADELLDKARSPATGSGDCSRSWSSVETLGAIVTLTIAPSQSVSVDNSSARRKQ